MTPRRLSRVFAPAILLLWLARPAAAEPSSVIGRILRDLRVDAGAHWFKLAADKPAELGPTAVFDRWESINASPNYVVHDYTALKPLYFNMVFGVDVLIRYRRYLMLKLGYDISYPFGIGGYGHIDYFDRATGVEVHESKSFSFTSHQLTTFIGPIVTVDDRADIYIAFSPMAPTWVRYHEKYERIENGVVLTSTNEHYRGFFGNCRALIGMQVRVTDHLKLGSEAVFAFLNYMQLESSTHTDSTFRFPFMQWMFTARYGF
jgi:opacity protein-like surface antigen